MPLKFDGSDFLTYLDIPEDLKAQSEKAVSKKGSLQNLIKSLESYAGRGYFQSSLVEKISERIVDEILRGENEQGL